MFGFSAGTPGDGTIQQPFFQPAFEFDPPPWGTLSDALFPRQVFHGPAHVDLQIVKCHDPVVQHQKKIPGMQLCISLLLYNNKQAVLAVSGSEMAGKRNEFDFFFGHTES